jgi:EAL domain-containing protein (putative c-di-GMP-specific phosphodiesterase class I)
MDLLRGIDTSPARRVIVAGVTQMAEALGISVIAEGIETEAEFETLREIGIALFQGTHGNQVVGNLVGVGWSGERPTRVVRERRCEK